MTDGASGVGTAGTRDPSRALSELEGDASRVDVQSSRVRRGLDAALCYRELVDLSIALPLAAGPSLVVSSVLDKLSTLFPHRAFGVCVVGQPSSDPIVELRLPVGVDRPGRDPTRLFPELRDEHVLELSGLPGSTLHYGIVFEPVDEESEEFAIVIRAAALLASAVRTSMALRLARPVSAEVATLRSQVIQSEKLASLGQLVAGVVHELANPVTSIVACTDLLLLKRTAPGMPEEDVEHLRRIGVAADRILKFSRDLVTYARPATEPAGAVALHEVIGQALTFCEHELGKHGVKFAADYGNGSPPVLGQAGPLTQVFVNLFTNAAHAMSEHGGRLEVRTHVDDELAVLRADVTDTGIGIPPEALSKVFEPFFTTKEKGRGTGLGLSIVQEIVAAHGGSIRAASTLGEGTTFSVSLPLFLRRRR